MNEPTHSSREMLVAAKLVGLTVAVIALVPSPATAQDVVTMPLPDGGWLPQAVVDGDGTTHVVYVEGRGARADLEYVTLAGGASTWSTPPVRVNSAEATVTAFGPVDGGQLAIGPDGRLHVAWFRIAPPTFFYTRSTVDGPGFEEQFGVASGDGIEAGPAVAVGPDDTVRLFWHAGATEDAARRLYAVTSLDGGFVFEPSRVVNLETAGACACCRPGALTDDTGTTYVSYRGAGDNVRRGQRLLVSADDEGRYRDELIQPWEVGACPVATTSLAAGPSGVTVAWETQGDVFFAGTDRLADPHAPPGVAHQRRKNPSVAINGQGWTLLAWGDGPGIRSGGLLHWQVFDHDGRPLGEPGGGSVEMPDGSVPAAVARPDGSFVIVH